MNIIRTESFKKDFKKLPAEMQKRAVKSLKLLFANYHHPSLHTKKMMNVRDIWEARVNYQYRLTFEKKDGDIILRRIGGHDVLKTP